MHPSALVSPLLLLVFATGALAKLPLPPYIRPCSLKLNPQELEACSLKSAQEAFPKFINGDRKYRIPSLNPLLVDRLVVDDGHGPLGLAMVATNARVVGVQNTKINHVKFDQKNREASYQVFLPEVAILCKYNISGRILLLPITGYGDANLTLTNVHVTYEYTYNLIKKKDGETYYIPNPHSNFQFNTTRLYVRLENLFNGDKLLGESTNKFMDENWEEMLKSLGPIFSTAISEIVHNILTNIFNLVPYTEAFTDAEAFKLP